MSPFLKNLLLSSATGLLLFLGWPPFAIGFLLFVAFVPLLLVEDAVEKKFQFWLLSYLSMLVWNTACTWWIWYASPGGTAVAIILNALLMTIPFQLYRFTKRSYGNRAAHISFVIYWLAFEYVHLSWDLSWPWLTLGNGFANNISMIQWYEYTGVLGGSLWILVINILVFNAVKKKHRRRLNLVSPVLLILIPLITSWSIDVPEGDKKEEVVIVQPNIDPYAQKFEDGAQFIPYDEQVEMMVGMASEKITAKTRYVLMPETAIQGNHDEKKLFRNPILNPIRASIANYPNVSYYTGIESYRRYRPEDKILPKEVRVSENGIVYCNFNAGLFMTSKGDSVYHKSRFVPGVEMLPWPTFFKFVLEIIDFKHYGSYGSQEERTVFFNNDSSGFVPAICYESIYGGYLAEHIRSGANYIFVITNDGWWNNTPGHRQHWMYSRLRAIEFRRWVARSANTGISCVINAKGEEVEKTKWWEKTTIKTDIASISEMTFYAQYGDYLGRLAGFLAIGFFISAFVRMKIKK